LPDVEPFSPGGRNPAAESGGGDEVVSGDLHRTVQPAAQVIRARVQWTLQGIDRGSEWHGVFENRVQLCASESGTSKVAGPGTGFAGISVEQLAGLLEASRPTAGVAAGGSVAGGIPNTPGHRGGPAVFGKVS